MALTGKYIYKYIHLAQVYFILVDSYSLLAATILVTVLTILTVSQFYS